MSIKNTKFGLACSMAILTFCAPFLGISQITEQTVAESNAEEDAEADINKPLWFGAGCISLGWAVGWLLLQETMQPGIISITPPASRLLGKSPEYVAYYTDAYKLKIQRLKLKWAAIGGATSCITGVGISCLVIGAAASSEPTYGYYVY